MNEGIADSRRPARLGFRLTQASPVWIAPRPALLNAKLRRLILLGQTEVRRNGAIRDMSSRAVRDVERAQASAGHPVAGPS